MRVVVVGAGLGGLSAACHLAGAGHRVTVLERDARPGGRAGVFARAGYRMDTGPVVLTMPGVLSRVFTAAGAELADHLTLRQLDPIYRATFAAAGDPLGGGVIHVRQGREAMAEEIRRACGPREAARYHAFRDWLTALYDAEMPHFIDRNYDSPLDLLKAPSRLAHLLRLGALRSLSSSLDDFFSDPRLLRLFGFQALYVGLSPFRARAMFAVITYMDTVGGVFYPVGGVHAVARALAAAAAGAGAELRYGAPVRRLLRRTGGAVTGAVLEDGEVVPADAVVANADLPFVYRELLGERVPRVARGRRYAPSCVVWLAGGRLRAEQAAAHHNLHFGESWRGAFRELVGERRLMSDPSTFVSVATRTDPTLAPPGRGTVYALEPVPNLDGRVDWARDVGRVRERLVDRVARLGYLDPAAVEVEAFTGPPGWAAAGLERGTPFSLAHGFFASGPFRPDNVARRAPGLFLTGAGTRPGVGVPMVLLSGGLAAARVAAYARAAGEEGRWRTRSPRATAPG